MVIDASDHLYVLGSSSQTNGGPMTGVILEYDPGATLPTQTITGSATGLVQPLAIAVDTKGNLFVEEYDPSAGNVRAGSVFSSSANGNVAPTSTFSITQYDTIVHDVPGLAVP
jgi:hypothetical protein